ncbi:hypothetical protein MicloDRAFT_00002010 [Microvirga lotononidis]|uniref:Uncharacterized protein n=2 Tax=Microvirga lotononidis TaxID=864069 RepID=I4Z4R9_9HYPH|nr:hypothetical protein MicloDRAFT_00002010 [Microvirga lotononidis]
MTIAMVDKQKELEDLAKADQDIADGERRVADQIILIEQMIRQGRDTALAEEFLRSLEQTLEQWHVHRRLILDALDRG